MKFNISDLVSALNIITTKYQNAVVVEYDEPTDHYRIVFVENGAISKPLWYYSDELTLL
jgi:hypothetical protein